jgi:DnaJ-class molecular chaperone
VVVFSRTVGPGFVQRGLQVCPQCGGSGVWVRQACATCQGTGTVSEAASVTVTLNGTAVDGARLVRWPCTPTRVVSAALTMDGTQVFAGQGHEPGGAGRPGDVMVMLAEGGPPHPVYARRPERPADLTATTSISLSAALLGTRVRLPPLAPGSEPLDLELRAVRLSHPTNAPHRQAWHGAQHALGRPGGAAGRGASLCRARPADSGR